MHVAKRRKRGKKRQTAPVSVAGLVTYFEEEVGGLKFRPELVIALAFGFIIVVILVHIFLPIP